MHHACFSLRSDRPINNTQTHMHTKYGTLWKWDRRKTIRNLTSSRNHRVNILPIFLSQFGFTRNKHHFFRTLSQLKNTLFTNYAKKCASLPSFLGKKITIPDCRMELFMATYFLKILSLYRQKTKSLCLIVLFVSKILDGVNVLYLLGREKSSQYFPQLSDISVIIVSE